MIDAQKSGVISFYDTHPINEDEILAKLASRGTSLDTLTEDELKDFDQDHYGGIDAVNILAMHAGVRKDQQVLDVCSGLGGPARWLAHRIGCRVTGIDFTQSRVESARRLTHRVKLDHLVDFIHGDATAMPLPDAHFDVVINQEAWVHIPDKPTVVAQCARVVKPGSVIAFTDIVALVPLAPEEESRLAAEMHEAGIVPVGRYIELLESSGCPVDRCEDLSEEWKGILAERLEMYRSLRDTTIAKFGAAHFAAWDRAYSFFVGLFLAGRLGGTRIVARRVSGYRLSRATSHAANEA
jgi:sarcosine/dimethylglycine N-methyltransferase